MTLFRIFLVITLLTSSAPSWSIEVTDQWSYVNIMFQTIFGALGVAVLSINFFSGRLFYAKEESEIQEYLQNHLDDLEEAAFQRRQYNNYIDNFEPIFSSLLSGEVPLLQEVQPEKAIILKIPQKDDMQLPTVAQSEEQPIFRRFRSKRKSDEMPK